MSLVAESTACVRVCADLRILGVGFNPVAPYRYRLPTVSLSVADIANPDFLVCCCQTWIRLQTVMTAVPRVGCVVWSLIYFSVASWYNQSTNNHSKLYDTLFTLNHLH